MASELLEDLEEMFHQYYMHSVLYYYNVMYTCTTCTVWYHFQSHTSVSSVIRGSIPSRSFMKQTLLEQKRIVQSDSIGIW